MIRRRRQRFAGTAIAACLGLLAACSEPAAQRTTAADAGSTLLRGNGPEPDSLDPQKARTVEAHNVLRDVCEGLTTLARDASPAPGVAKTWDVSADGRTYTFHLRSEARWMNGDPVVADDFVAALQRLVDPKTASQYAQIVDVIENATDVIGGGKAPTTLGVNAPDAATVVVKLTTPAPYLLGVLAHPSTCPVHRATLAAHPTDYSKPGVLPANGAFALVEWKPNASILVKRNRAYWNDAATTLDAVRFVQQPDENAELRLYRAGELHFTYVVPRGQFDWIKANLAQELHLSPQLNTYYFGFNLERPLFRDSPQLRRALSLVIDRERLAKVVLRVGELPANGWVPPGTYDYTPQSFDYAGKPMAERIAEARELYAAAGYSAQKPLSFELRYNSGDVHNKVAVAVSAMWRETLGVDAKLVAVDFKTLLGDIDRRDVDMFRLAWLGDYNDAYTFAQYLRSDFGINLPRYRSAAYDSLVMRAAGTADTAERRKLLEEAERVMLADHPLLPIYHYVNKHLVKPEVRGWYDNVMNVVYSRDLALR